MTDVRDSILQSTKKILGIADTDPSFDLDVMTHINSVFMTLDQLGVGPRGGFMIEDASTEWWDLLGDDPRLNAVKSLVYAKVRLLFDPPTVGHHVTALEKQIDEMSWRLMVAVNPTPMVTPVVVEL